ncbi:uncharacterized protein A1O5_11085, partial [Cladophialophora psammophila CBS 110553]
HVDRCRCGFDSSLRARASRKHIDAALKEGATPAEIIEVIEVAGTLGIHACKIEVPLLVEVMKEEGIYDKHASVGKPFDEKREKLKADFTKNRGYWHPCLEGSLSAGSGIL